MNQRNLFDDDLLPTRSVESLGGLGILSEKDLDDFSDAVKRIYQLMKDGHWHSSDEILSVSGQREGLRRMRELRQFYAIERRCVGGRLWAYRLTPCGSSKQTTGP